jgi:hypothetical protein
VAEADECYRFHHWSGSDGFYSTGNVVEITINGSSSVTAHFEFIKYTLNISSTTGGSVSSPGEGAFQYNCGEDFTLEAEAEPGYHLTHWYGGYLSTGDSETITMNFTAHFEKDQATCTSTILYVDVNAPGPTHNGASWATAYKYLRDALMGVNSCPTVNQIWVAKGTYKPDADSSVPAGSGNRNATFQLINGVTLEGGFAGFGEPNPNARDIEAYETILSGDIGNIDDNADNSYSIVTGSGTDSTAILDGFTITAGNANGSAPSQRAGGAIYCDSGSPTVTYCKMIGNSAGYGAGVGNYNSSSPTISRCVFINNTAQWNGGGMRNYQSSPRIVNCNFIENSAEYGGGLHNEDHCSTVITNCSFIGNSASNSGGGVFNDSQCSPVITNCIFSGNLAGFGGGFFDNVKSNSIVTNCSFSNNAATSKGGGIRINDNSSTTVNNCILWGNTATAGRGPQMALRSNSKVSVNNSDVQGGQSAIYLEVSSSISKYVNNIDTNPLFIDPNGPDNILGTADDDLQLLANSPCIDAGDNTRVPSDATDLDEDANTGERVPLDLGGGTRFVNDLAKSDTGVPDLPDYPDIVDIGAYEFGICGGPGRPYPQGDVNHDCEINFFDIAVVADNWLTST